MVRRRTLLYAGVVAIVVSMAGCTGAGKSTDDTLTYAMPNAPKSLDFPADFNGSTAQLVSAFQQTLERVNQDGTMVPLLAASVETPDDRTIIYHLRESVKFSNGEPLTAEDVVWSVQHTFDAKSGAQSASTVTTLDTVHANGPHSVTVRLTRPDPMARANIGQFAFVQNAAFATAQGSALGTATAVPVGTGPYRVSVFSASELKMEANPHYWGERPVIAKLNFVFIPDDNAAQLAMRSNQIQGATLANSATARQWAALPGATVGRSSSVRSFFLSLDVATPPFDDIHVRKAVAHAVDRGGLIENAFGSYAKPLKGIVPASAIASVAPTPEVADQFLNSLPQHEFDLAAARAELARSAVPNGFAMTIPYPSTFGWARLTLLNLQQNLGQIGITVEPKSVPSSEWRNTIYTHQNLGAQVMTVSSVPADPSGGLAYLVGKANAAPGSTNTANYLSDPVEQSLEKLNKSTDRGQRWEATKTIMSSIAADVPYVPLFEPDFVYVLGGGFQVTGELTVQRAINGEWVSLLTR